jgi:hypothetical protein
MFKLTEAQIQRELRAAAAAEAAERVWRRRWRGVLAGCFASQLTATAVGASGLAMADERLGGLLLAVGQVGVVLGPFTIAVIWVVEAHRRGDL